MHAMSHFNGGHLKPRNVGLSKQLWIITCKCLGKWLAITDLFVRSVLIKVLHHLFILIAAIMKPRCDVNIKQKGEHYWGHKQIIHIN